MTIKAYLKWEKLVWFKNNWIGGVPTDFDNIVESFTEDDIKKLRSWYLYQDWKVVENLEEKKEKVREECGVKIVSKYSITDQLNTMMFWTTAENTAMKKYIKNVLKEYRGKWIKADFDSIK